MSLGGVAHLLEQEHIVAHLLEVGGAWLVTKLVVNDNGVVAFAHDTVRTLHRV